MNSRNTKAEFGEIWKHPRHWRGDVARPFMGLRKSSEAERSERRAGEEKAQHGADSMRWNSGTTSPAVARNNSASR